MDLSTKAAIQPSFTSSCLDLLVVPLNCDS